MKKAFLSAMVVALLSVCSTKTYAQFMGTFEIQGVTGLPDTVNNSGSYTFGFIVANTGNTIYSGTIDFDFYVDTFSPGAMPSFGTGQVGGFTPGDTITLPVTYAFTTNGNTFNIGDNVVVVWPRGIGNSTASDSLVFHVYVTNFNSVEESGKTTSELKAFPIPATDFLSFSSEKDKISEIRIYDMSGRLVVQSKTHLNVFTGNLTAGVYIAEAVLVNGDVTRKKIVAGRE